MSRIFVTSDLHIGHNRDFVWGARGFQDVFEHDQGLVRNWNETVAPDDTVYVLGDIYLVSKDLNLGMEYGLSILRQLNGHLIILRGNHDSEDKLNAYSQCENVVSAGDAALYLKYPELGGYTFYMSHYPTLVSHDSLKKMKSSVINLFGHTHQTERFYKDHPYMYCVCLDAHDMKPKLLDEIIEEIKHRRSQYHDNMLVL